MREGGLKWQRYKVLYGQIKQNHKRVLRQLNRDKEEIDEMKKNLSGKLNFIFYLRYLWLQVDMIKE